MSAASKLQYTAQVLCDCQRTASLLLRPRQALGTSRGPDATPAAMNSVHAALVGVADTCCNSRCQWVDVASIGDVDLTCSSGRRRPANKRLDLTRAGPGGP